MPSTSPPTHHFPHSAPAAWASDTHVHPRAFARTGSWPGMTFPSVHVVHSLTSFETLLIVTSSDSLPQPPHQIGPLPWPPSFSPGFHFSLYYFISSQAFHILYYIIYLPLNFCHPHLRTGTCVLVLSPVSSLPGTELSMWWAYGNSCFQTK